MNPRKEEDVLGNAALQNLKAWQFDARNHDHWIRLTFSCVIDTALPHGALPKIDWALPDQVTIRASPPPTSTAGQMIVAGDGNAYLPYAYFIASEGGTESFLAVLRISLDGTSQNIELGHWTGVTVKNFFDPNAGYLWMEPGIYYNVPWLTAITNGDSGAAILSQLDINTCEQTTSQPLNQISYVSQDGLDSQVTLAIDPTVNNWWPNPVSLSLQREDGSYIGADKEGNLFAIGADGSVVWQQQLGAGALTPLYATADGGAIVTTTTPPCQPTWARSRPTNVPAKHRCD